MASVAKGKGSRIAVWIILLLLIVGLAGFSVTNFGGSIRSIGTVGDSEIDLRRYSRELQQELATLSQRVGTNITFAQAQQAGVDRQILQRLVSFVALEDEADKLGLSIGDEVVRDQLLNAPQFLGIDGTFDREGYRFVLERSGQTETEYENSLRTEVSRSILQAAVISGAETPETFLDTIFDFELEERSFIWAPVGTDLLAEPVGEPTEADLQAHYDANPDDFMLPETRAITYAWITPDMIVDEMEIDEEALQDLYQTQINNYVRPERRLVERLIFSNDADADAAKAALDDGGKSFEDIVAERELTLEDIDLGDVTEDELGDAGADVFALTEPGVAGPLPTNLGPALFRMNAILAAQETTFDEARPELAEALAQERARRDIGDQIDGLDDLLAGGATVEELADETDLQLGTIDWTGAATDGIAGYEGFRAAAAAAEVGAFPEVLELDDGGLFALRLDEVIDPRLQPFEDARAAVEEAWRAAETATRLTDRAEALIAEMQGGATGESLGLLLTQEDQMRRSSFLPGTPPNFLQEIFEMEEGNWRTVSGAEGVFIARLDGISAPDPEDPENARQREAFAQGAAQSVGNDLLAAFAAAVEADAGITLNQPAIAAVHANLQ